MSNIKRYASLYCHNWSLILWFRKRRILVTDYCWFIGKNAIIFTPKQQNIPWRSFVVSRNELRFFFLSFFYRVEMLLSTRNLSRQLESFLPELYSVGSSSRTTHRCFANTCIHNVRWCYTQFLDLWPIDDHASKLLYECREANRSTTDPWNRWTILLSLHSHPWKERNAVNPSQDSMIPGSRRLSLAGGASV